VRDVLAGLCDRDVIGEFLVFFQLFLDAGAPLGITLFVFDFW
jgi:hypothetical protein